MDDIVQSMNTASEQSQEIVTTKVADGAENREEKKNYKILEVFHDIRWKTFS